MRPSASNAATLLVGELAAVAVVPLHLGAGGLAARLDLLVGAVAVVGAPASRSRASDVGVDVGRARTAVRAVRAADLGPSSQSRPSQRSDVEQRRRRTPRCCGRASVSSMRKHERAAVVARERPVEQRRAGEADVRVAGRDGRHPDADRLAGSRVGQSRLTTLLVRVPMPCDRDLDLVAGLHRTDTLGGAGEDHVAGQQRHHAGDVGDQGRDVEDQSLVRPSCLTSPLRCVCTLQRRDGSRSVSIHGPSGQNESKPLARVNWPSLLLQVARGHVVADRVAVDHVGAFSAGTSRQIRPITTASSPSKCTFSVCRG